MLEIESRMQLMQRQHNEVMFCTVLQAELWGMQALGEMNKANADELERVNTRVRQVWNISHIWPTIYYQRNPA